MFGIELKLIDAIASNVRGPRRQYLDDESGRPAQPIVGNDRVTLFVEKNEQIRNDPTDVTENYAHVSNSLSDGILLQEISDQEDELDQNSFMCEAW